MASTKTLILIRHGHRDTSRRELDNGLDEKGKDQAKALKRFFTARFTEEDFKKGLWFVSSPKTRCVETLLPMAKAFNRSVDLHPDLIEQSASERSAALEVRVQRFLKEWVQSKADLTVLCSHGDWLPLAVHHLLGFAYDFRKGGWLEIEWESDHAYLKWCIPSFKALF